MKVGLYIPGIDRGFVSGPTKYQINLARALSDLNEIELFLLHHRGVYPFGIEAKHIIIAGRTPMLWEVKLRKCNLDIVHFNVIPTALRIFFPILNCKKVVTIHGDLHWIKEIFVDYERINYRIRRLTEPWLSQFIDAIITVSKDLKTRLKSILKADESKMKVIHEGVSSAYRTLENINGIKEKYNISRPFVFHVSNLSPKKNPQTLLKAFGQLLRNNHDLDLVIAGARWTNKQLDNIIEELDLLSNVRILGYIHEQDLIRLYNAAELFFYPSFHETFGFPVVEAMACGTPVVTSNAYSIPEVAGDAAILCDPYDFHAFAEAMEQILKNEGLRKEMVLKGLKNVRRFSWKNCAIETTKIYKETLLQE